MRRKKPEPPPTEGIDEPFGPPPEEDLYRCSVCGEEMFVNEAIIDVGIGMAKFQREYYAGFMPKRSEEHTSELQSQSNLVCRLLLEEKSSQHLSPRGKHLRCASRKACISDLEPLSGFSASSGTLGRVLKTRGHSGVSGASLLKPSDH